MESLELAPPGSTEIEQLARELAESRAETQRVLAFQRELLSALSHEIRTPMHAIIGTTGLLLERNLDPDGRELAETIERGCDSMLGLVTNMIDLAALEGSAADTKPARFDLARVIEDVLESAIAKADFKNIELSVFLPSHIPTELRGDRARLQRLLLNLVGLGIRFADRGELTIEAKKLDETKRHIRVRIEVQELSKGLTKAAAEQISAAFDKPTSNFLQLDPVSLAVAVCRRLCEALGGSLGVDCQPGKGSRYWVELRFGKSESMRTGIPDLSGSRILVVEAHAQLRRSIGHHLAIAGARSESAAGGTEALERIRKASAEGHGYSLVITGAHLPDMVGASLVKKARAVGEAILPFVRLRETKIRTDASAELFLGELGRPVRRVELYGLCLASLGRAKPSSPRSAPAVGATRRILIAEDHPLSQKVAARMLEGLGYRADVVGDGHEVLAALKKQHYDLVLMDCMMPEMDGLTATTEIRRREAKATGEPVRIVAMTASAMTGDRERCLAAGMDDYLSKPVQASELLTMLRRWL